MTSLAFLADLVSRGVIFFMGEDGLVVRDLHRVLRPEERGLIVALKPTIRGLLIQQLPDRRGEHACDEGFEAAAGAALCERCAFGIADHFWRRTGDCTFVVGSAADATCRRCGVPALEHLSPKRVDAP